MKGSEQLNHFRLSSQPSENQPYFLPTMYFSAIFVILSAFEVYSGHAGLVTAKLKLSQSLAAENDACPPGVWTCSTGKRSQIGKASRDTIVDSQKSSQASEDACPPGVWTCSTGKRSEITKEAPVISEASLHKDESDSKEQEICPPKSWVCKQKRMLKQMLKKAANKQNLPRALENACPPGVWTCSTGKR